LVIAETHPVQYHAPVYRAAAALGVPLTVVYGSDFSVAGYRDGEFGAKFAWDTDLLAGYDARFLTRVSAGGPASYDAVRADGLASALAELSPTAVLLVGYASPFDRGAIKAAGRYRLLFRAETADHAQPRSQVRGWLRDRVLGRFYRQCSKLLYVGRRSRDHYHRLGVRDERLVFSPYCVDTTPFRTDEPARAELRSAARAELGAGPNDLVVLFSGKLSPRKGVDLLPEAVGRLRTGERTRFRLAAVGDGELRGELERAGVRVLGFRNQTGLSPYYHGADLLALPSRHSETWGLVVNEALHHGLPCVVSDQVGSAPDLVTPGRTGEVFRAGDVDDLTATLRRATALVGRADVRAACREGVGGYSVVVAAAGVARAFAEVNSA
jgi:glycosyltransferase involved in cell wall biosynthesis